MKNVSDISDFRKVKKCPKTVEFEQLFGIAVEDIPDLDELIQTIVSQENEVVYPNYETAYVVSQELLRLPQYEGVLYFEITLCVGRKGAFYRTVPVRKSTVRQPVVAPERLYEAYLKKYDYINGDGNDK